MRAFFSRFGYTYDMEFDSDRPTEWLSQLFPFSLLDEGELRDIAPMVEVIECPRESQLYAAGDIPDYFYWILSGDIQLTAGTVRRGKREQNLAPGDYFGAEVLSKTDYRFSQAVSLTNSKLARINEQDLNQLREQFPVLKKALSLIYQTHKFRSRLFLPWLENDEKVNLVCRKHPFFLILRILLVGGVAIGGFAALLTIAISGKSVGLLLLALLFLLLGLFFTAWSALEWSNDYFILTSDRVLVQKKLTGFFDSRQEAPYPAILSTGLESTIWGRLVGFGTIFLRTYNGNLSFKRLPVPGIIFELLEYQRKHITRESRQTEHDEMRETLKQRLHGKSVGTEQPSSSRRTVGVKTTYASGSLLDLAARFFGLRRVRSGSVIYRTHWWRLLGKTFIPSLLLLTVVVFIILKMLDFMPALTETQAYAAAFVAAIVIWAWWLYQYQDWYNDIYIISTDQLVDVDRKPLGKEERRSAPIQNIQTVEFKRKGIVGLILNFGTVRIQIGNQELTFDDVYNPAAIQAEIFSRFKDHNDKSFRVEQEKLADWITTYDEIRKENRNQGGNDEIYR